MQNALDLFSFTDKSQLMKGHLCLVWGEKKNNEWFLQLFLFRLLLCWAGVARLLEG